MSPDEDRDRFRQWLRVILRLIYDFLNDEDPLRVRIYVPLNKEGTLVTVAPAQPFPIHDNQSLSLGLALEGDNPNGLTITSAVWSVDAVVTIDQTPPALTASAVAAAGTEGTASVTAAVTLSDGSTLTTAAFEIAVTAVPVPLSVVIVPGTPTP